MYCDEALEAVEAVAAGELTPDGRIAEHYASCPNCAAALETARALEQLLQHRDAPRPSAQFTSRTMTRVRRLRWRTEQFLDVGFNVVIATIVLAVVFGGWIALDRTGFSVIGTDAIELFSRGLVIFAQRVGRS